MSKFYCSMSKASTEFVINLNNVLRISYEPVHHPAISFTIAHKIVYQKEFLTCAIIKNRVFRC